MIFSSLGLLFQAPFTQEVGNADRKKRLLVWYRVRACVKEARNANAKLATNDN